MKFFKIPMFVTSLFGLGLLSSLDTRAVQADYIFGTPTVITDVHATSPSVSTDGLSLYVDSTIPGGYGGYDIWVYTRETIHHDWGEPVNAGQLINTWRGDGNPDIWPDGLTLVFDSDRPSPNGQGGWDMWMVTRETPDGPWSELVNLGPPVNGPYLDAHSSISSDGLSLFFCSTRPNGYGDRDIYVSTRATIRDDWSQPVNLGSTVNSPSLDDGPDISSDGLTLFFASDRPGGYGGEDIWVTRRATTHDPWSVPVNLGPIVNNSNYNDTPCISADGSILYWWSTIGRLRQVPIIPIVDFTKDGKVDHLDIGLMMINWGTNDSLYDIGPTPLGDGIVDSKDLMVLAEHGAMLAGDVNFDGVVDFFDLAEVAKNWLRQQP